MPGGGRVSFGPGGGSVEVPGAGRLEVRRDGIVLLPDGTFWNTRGLLPFPNVDQTPTGSVGLIPPGALRCSVDFRVALRGAIAAAGVPPTPYFSITDVLADAWTEGFAGFSPVVQYPSFAQWPGALAPPMPALGQTLSVGGSSGMWGMFAIALHAAVINAVASRTLPASRRSSACLR